MLKRGLLVALLWLAPVAADPLRWNLAEIYPDQQHWEQARLKLSQEIPALSRYQGKLGQSPARLREALAEYLRVRKELDRLMAYSSMLADEDLRASEPAELNQKAQQLAVALSTTTSYWQPELLQMGKARVSALINKDPELTRYRAYFDHILELAPYTRSGEVEKVAAQTGNLQSAGHEIRSVFANAELPYPEVKLSDGQTVRLDASGYGRYRALPNRQDRQTVFRAFWSRYQEFRRTLASSLLAQLQAHVFQKELRGYKSCLEASLLPERIPTEVYHQLIRDVHDSLPTLHRYLKLRKKLMKIETLGYEDLYAPIVSGVDLRYTPAQAIEMSVASVAPLGKDYQRVLEQAFRQGWTDWMPRPGKRSGAYSNGGAFDVHPYQLLNFNGNYEDVSTCAHEAGHSMHSYLANKTQPYGLHDYSLFVAEVASTLNENLLFHHALKQAKNKEEKLFLLGSYLEGLRTTLFRQTMLAEFELKVHQQAEQGQPLTGDSLNALYLELLRKYYGHEQGICTIDELYAVEWAYIPHFYYNFYVYQYATSLVASTNLARAIREEAPATTRRDAYLKMLSLGRSKTPIELLKGAGVDMTTSQPFRTAMQEMNLVMDQIEELSGPGRNSAYKIP